MEIMSQEEIDKEMSYEKYSQGCHKAFGSSTGEKIDGLLTVTAIEPNFCEVELENSKTKIKLTNKQAGELSYLMDRICYSMGFMQGEEERKLFHK
jgi:hypothetical protein